MTRRILAIIVALVLAGLGTAGVLLYALSADDRAREAIGNPVTVVVASKRIPVGTSGARIRSENLVRLVTMPSTSVPDDVMDRVPAELDKLVVTSNIAAGQLLLRAHFGEATTVTSGLPLPDKKMAITVTTGAPEQVAGYVQPGSKIVIFLTYAYREPGGKRTDVQRTRVLLPRVEVLAVGTYQPGRDGVVAARGGGPSLLITVAVDQQEAERLVHGLNTGSLYLGLLSDSVEVRTGSGVDDTDAGGSVPLFTK